MHDGSGVRAYKNEKGNRDGCGIFGSILFSLDFILLCFSHIFLYNSIVQFLLLFIKLIIIGVHFAMNFLVFNHHDFKGNLLVESWNLFMNSSRC